MFSFASFIRNPVSGSYRSSSEIILSNAMMIFANGSPIVLFLIDLLRSPWRLYFVRLWYLLKSTSARYSQPPSSRHGLVFCAMTDDPDSDAVTFFLKTPLLQYSQKSSENLIITSFILVRMSKNSENCMLNSSWSHMSRNFRFNVFSMKSLLKLSQSRLG